MNVQKPVAILSSREFNQDTASAKRAAAQHPVFITTRGEISHVLMSKREFDRLTGSTKSLREALVHPKGDEFDFEPPRLDGPLFRPAEFD